MAISSVENRHCDSFDKIKEKFSKQSTFMGGGQYYGCIEMAVS